MKAVETVQQLLCGCNHLCPKQQADLARFVAVHACFQLAMLACLHFHIHLRKLNCRNAEVYREKSNREVENVWKPGIRC